MASKQITSLSTSQSCKKPIINHLHELCLWLFEHEHVHGREETLLATLDECNARIDKHLVNGNHALRGDVQVLCDGDQRMVELCFELEQLQAGGQSPPPGCQRTVCLDGQVTALEQLEADILSGVLGDLPAPQVWQSVPDDNFVSNGDVRLVLVVIVRCRDPLVGHKDAPWLQAPVHLRVDLLQSRSVASGFDGVRSIECLVLEGHLQEVSPDGGAEVGESQTRVVIRGTVHLVLVDGDTRNLPLAGRRDGAHGSTDTASDVECLLSRSEADERRDASLVGRLTGGPVFARKQRGEMERGSPSPFIQVGNEGVELVDQVGDLLLPVNDGTLSTFQRVELVIIVLNLLASRSGSTWVRCDARK